MNIDKARRLITLHDNADRALSNLRNAGAMSTDDPRATELLEEAGDAYAEALVALTETQDSILDIAPPPEGGLLDSEDRAREAAAGVAPPTQPTGSAPGAEDPQPGGGQVQSAAEHGTNAEAPADAPSGPESAGENPRRGKHAEDAQTDADAAS